MGPGPRGLGLSIVFALLGLALSGAPIPPTSCDPLAVAALQISVRFSSPDCSLESLVSVTPIPPKLSRVSPFQAFFSQRH